KGLYDRVLFVSELPKLLPKTFYPPTNIPQPVALKASKGARVLSRSERVNASSSVSLSPQDESSKRHVKAGDPVSMVTGEEHLSLVDVRL
ncbi:rhs family domain protein, partial [Vibrio harveyi]